MSTAKNLASLKGSFMERFSESHLTNMKRILDVFLPFVMLLIGFMLFFQFFVEITPVRQQILNWMNWGLIGYFAARLGLSYKLSKDHSNFMHKHWLDIMLVVPVFSMMQEVRLLGMFAEAEEASMTGQFMASSTLSNTSNAAKMTRIVRIIKRSVGL